MKKTGELIRLIHNPNAGEGQKKSLKDVISMIEAHGYNCGLSSSKKKPLKRIEPETTLIVLAGGDGTIRRMIMQLLNKKLKYKRTIALLPLGTANNIANSLSIPPDPAKNIASWAAFNLKKFDVGQVLGLSKPDYFIEAFGFGLFPKLMKVMSLKNSDHVNAPEDEFQMALDTLLELTRNYKAISLKMETNDEVFDENYILVEIMNISSIGPRLNLGEKADPGDGYFDLVMVRESERALMEEYINQRRQRKEVPFPIKPIRVKKLVITWQGEDAHIDDELIDDCLPTQLKISLLDSLLEILTPEKET